MLQVDVRTLRQGSTPIEATVAPNDPMFAGLGIELMEPVRISGTLQSAGEGSFRLEGRAVGKARGECRRCLTEVTLLFDVEFDAVFTTSLDLVDDPGVYRLTEPVTRINLTEAVREEVGFAVPTWALCRDACAGLCPRCGADLNQGPCG
ncbi:MAG TPA: DUF177 domain-containing protein, partial [Gemmatimonadales bacterium]